MKARTILTFTSEVRFTVEFTEIKIELERAARFYGIYSRVARKIGVSSQHVKEVAMMRRTSDRVQRAIVREFVRTVKKDKAA